jgi:hypothetical protein
MGRKPDPKVEADREIARRELKGKEFLGQPRKSGGVRAFSAKVLDQGLTTIKVRDGKPERIESKRNKKTS